MWRRDRGYHARKEMRLCASWSWASDWRKEKTMHECLAIDKLRAAEEEGCD